MKRHILVTSNIETQGNEDEGERQSLIQIEEDAKRRAEQRLILFLLKKITSSNFGFTSTLSIKAVQSYFHFKEHCQCFFVA